MNMPNPYENYEMTLEEERGLSASKSNMIAYRTKQLIKLKAEHTKLRSAHAKLLKVVQQFKKPRRGPPRAAKIKK